MARQLQMFGGGWTERKLNILGKYLSAYTTALKKQDFELSYVDAFAGTGYREAPEAQPPGGFFAQELNEAEPQEFLEGSARIALRTKPPFDRYVFVERSARKFRDLQQLRDEFRSVGDRMVFLRGDANERLVELCTETNWLQAGKRGVVFLDPFGMQIDWTTMESIAGTRAIDTWVLFPLGVAVMRLLKRDGDIPDQWRRKLTAMFGTDAWYDRFYQRKAYPGFFGEVETVNKTGDYNAIADYYQERLRTIFPAVADNPCVLYNSTGVPLYLFCFAIGNPGKKAIALALSMAEDILLKG